MVAAALRLSFLSGFPDFVGANATVAYRNVPLEAGVHLDGYTIGFYGRSGIMYALNAVRREPRAPNLFLSHMVGYRHMETVRWLGPASFNGVSATTALDVTGWIGDHVGVDVQATVGLDVWPGNSPSRRRVSPDFRLAVGVAFR